MQTCREWPGDPQWLQGQVVESSSLILEDPSEPHRDIRLVKIALPENHASYEPGVNSRKHLSSCARVLAAVTLCGKGSGQRFANPIFNWMLIITSWV